MATILLIGSDAALLEGLAQTLGAVGHQARIADTVSEGVELSIGALPLIAVVERTLAAPAEALRIPLQPGGALVLYRSRATDPAVPVSHAVQRLTLAELMLPLERHRLVALTRHVEERARQAGRGGRPTVDESSGEQRA